MALIQTLLDSGQLNIEDRYTVPESLQVVFTCKAKEGIKNKRSEVLVGKLLPSKVKGILSGAVSVSVNSKWENALGTAVGGSISKIVDIAERGAQFIGGGSTIRQPWFSRKFWMGTDAIKLNIPIKFVSYENAELEVYAPMIKLLSLAYPRLTHSLGDVKFLGGLGDLLSLYHIPGPSLFYPLGEKNGNSGDVVGVKVGSFIDFEACYIENITVNIPNVFTPEGYPHYVEANVQITSMDSTYVQKDGTFMPFHHADFGADGFTKALDKITGIVKKIGGK